MLIHVLINMEVHLEPMESTEEEVPPSDLKIQIKRRTSKVSATLVERKISFRCLCEGRLRRLYNDPERHYLVDWSIIIFREQLYAIR